MKIYHEYNTMHLANVKHAFHDRIYQHYPFIAAWARARGFKPHNVSVFLAGSSQGIRGEARKIRQAIEQTVRFPIPLGKKTHKE